MFKCLLLRNYIENRNFAEDIPMIIPGQIGFNHIVVSEKKAFEYFPIGSNVNLCIADPMGKCSNAFFSETTL
jgi:hypothetical protein